MFRNDYSSKRVSATIWNSFSLWRSVILALMLAITIGSVEQTYPARAAPAATELRYSLSARKLKGNNATICVGDDVPIHVRVTRAEFNGDQGSNVQEITGARIEASMSNGGIGRLNPISIHTGWDSNDPGGADYKFHTEKVGTTTLFFKGTINHVWWPAKLGLSPLVDRKDFVKDQLEIKVEECQYKVTTISKWQVPGEANIKIEAWINEAGLKDDGTGHYTGTANVTWQITTSQVVDCKAQSVTTTSEATLNGERDEDQIIVDIDFLTANILMPAFCVADGDIASGSTPVQMTPEAATFTVPASGGGDRLTHVLQGPESVSGFIVVIVTQAHQQ